MQTNAKSKKKEKLEKIERVKFQKKSELGNLYSVLTQETKDLDLLMILIAREIERIFPDLQFQLIARIKADKSFENKVQNYINKCDDSIKKIQEIRIFDIIGLNIIVENVPDTIISQTFKNSWGYDQDFDSNITDLIEQRRKIMQDIQLCDSNIERKKEEYRELEQEEKRKQQEKERKEKLKQEKQAQLAEMEELLNSSKSTDKKIIQMVIDNYKKDLENYDIDIQNLEKDLINIKHQMKLCRDDIELEEKKKQDFKMIYENQVNQCNYEMARFIIRRLTMFEAMKGLNLKEIKNRFKIIEKDNGYRSVHNSYEKTVKRNGKSCRFVFEIQGKSISDYVKANEGRAASYHIAPVAKKGKILKNKNLPNILSVNSEEEKQEFLEWVNQNVPKFRIYRKNSQGAPEVYVFSLRECYMFYFYNQLFGNQLLGIPKNTAQLEECAQGHIFPDDGKIYRDCGYIDL